MNDIDKWISVEDELPEDGHCILVWTNANVPLVVRYHDGIGFVFRGEYKKVKFWQPLPSPPQEKQE